MPPCVFPPRVFSSTLDDRTNRQVEMQASSRKELLDENCGVVRILFRKEVAALHRLSARVRSPLPPDAERPGVFRVKSIERTALGPEMQHRAFDLFRCFLIRMI